MNWINLQVQQLRQRYRRQTKQATINAQLKKGVTTEAKTTANSNQEKAKLKAIEVGKDLKTKGASKMKSTNQIDAPTPTGTSPPVSGSGYQPKGLPPRGKGRGKGRSR
jgi:hypothetical protein